MLGWQSTRDPLHVGKLRLGNIPKRILGTNLDFIPTLHKRGCSYNLSLQSLVMFLYGKKKPFEN